MKYDNSEFQIIDLSHQDACNDTTPQEPLFSRWQSFCGICLYVSVAGTTYAFAIYSQLLKNNLGYSQSALDMIASIGTTGLYLSLMAGFAIEKIGFRSVVFYGGLFIFVGFMYIYLAIMEKVPADIYSISFFYFLSQAGVCCHITSAVTVAVKLFPPESRGLAIGLSKGYFGLSTAVLGDLAGGYFEKTPSLFLVFIAVFIPIVGNCSCYYPNCSC
jgi:MFS family permease